MSSTPCRSKGCGLVLGLSLLLLAGACVKSSRPGLELKHDCQLAVSSDRSALVYISGGELILRKAGVETRIPFASQPCLKQGQTTDLLALSKNGAQVVVLGEEAREFNLHESVPFDATVCCLVDFDKRQAVELAPLFPEAKIDLQVRHRQVKMGTQRNLVYTWVSLSKELFVLDLSAGREARLELEAGSGCDLVELGQSTLLACPAFSGSGHTGYDHFIRLQRIDFSTWPPQAEAPRQIAVAAGLSGVALSRDGRLLGYWGFGFGDMGDFKDIHGVLEVETGKRLFEKREQRQGHVTAMAFSPKGDALLLGEFLRQEPSRHAKIDMRGHGGVSKLDLQGQRQSFVPLDDQPRAVHWLPSGILCELGCRAVELKSL